MQECSSWTGQKKIIGDMKLTLEKVQYIVQDCLVAQNELKIFDPEEYYSRTLKKIREYLLSLFYEILMSRKILEL